MKTLVNGIDLAHLTEAERESLIEQLRSTPPAPPGSESKRNQTPLIPHDHPVRNRRSRAQDGISSPGGIGQPTDWSCPIIYPDSTPKGWSGTC